MAQAGDCLGHQERENRRNKILNLVESSKETPDENLRVTVRDRSGTRSWSLKELEDDFGTQTEWKRIKEEGGVLSIPMEELRMENPPRPDNSGKVVFKEKKGGGGKQIESYPVIQTIELLNALIRDKYEEEKQKAKASGMSESGAEKKAFAEATKLPQFKAVNAWQDTNAEIKLKKALEKMMVGLKIPALLIRSVNLKQLSALNDLGLKLARDAEIDLMMAYLSGDFLHVNVYEVKRSDTYPWETKSRPPNKQAVNKAENQLTKDLDILMAILAGIPPDQIVFHTLACYPDTPVSELGTIICKDCLENGVVCQEDLNDLSLLQKKSQVPDKTLDLRLEAWFFQIASRWFLSDLVTIEDRNHLLTLTARFLSDQSLLHNGYREVADQEHLVTERHKFNIQTVDGKMMQSEFVVASPQQQQAIASFTAADNNSADIHTFCRRLLS
jgi:hypothetical protein